jgi:hypothetical protein
VTKVALRHRTEVLMQLDSEQERLLARLQMRTQTAIDAARRRRAVHGPARRDLVLATLVKSLAQNGVMFQDDRLDHITDAIMTGRRVDASTVLVRADAKRSGPPEEAAAEG